jgi:KDO2-lipid IV(A) lauroyltransferase
MSLNIKDLAGALVFHAGRSVMRNLDPTTASDLGAAIARRIGPPLTVSTVANVNIHSALPCLDVDARRRVIRETWENLGRNAGELPHLHSLERTASGPGWEIQGEDILRAQAARGGPAIFFSAHIGNWEMLPPILARLGIAMSSVYRPLSNRSIDTAVNGMRRQMIGKEVPMFPKGAAGARGAIRHLMRGGYLGMLVDQKMNDGIPVEFFGKLVMTAPALAVMALRLRCPVIPGRIRRLGPARLRLEVDPPLLLPETDDRQADIAILMRSVNAVLERWITDDPGAWLWLHRRWPKTPLTMPQLATAPRMGLESLEGHPS